MLISIVLTLTTEKAIVLPADLGRAVYAETLETLGHVDRQLAGRIHEGDGPKPLTCSTLLGGSIRSGEVRLEPGGVYTVRLTGLQPQVSAGLRAVFLQRRAPALSLHKHPFRIVDATDSAEKHPWAGQATYEALAARHAAPNKRPARKATLEFASPTAFKSAEKQIPIPLPNLVFGSLVERWNAFSPFPLDPEMRRFGDEAVAISRYELRSIPVRQKHGALRIGGVGTAVYVALGPSDPYKHAAMQMLADFALYSGVGVQTTNGMGQVRRLR